MSNNIRNLDDYISCSEFARKNGVTLNAVRHQIKVGHITDCMKIGGTYYINKNTEYMWHKYKTGKYVDWRKKHPTRS